MIRIKDFIKCWWLKKRKMIRHTWLQIDCKGVVKVSSQRWFAFWLPDSRLSACSHSTLAHEQAISCVLMFDASLTPLKREARAREPHLQECRQTPNDRKLRGPFSKLPRAEEKLRYPTNHLVRLPVAAHWGLWVFPFKRHRRVECGCYMVIFLQCGTCPIFISALSET